MIEQLVYHGSLNYDERVLIIATLVTALVIVAAVITNQVISRVIPWWRGWIG